MSSFTNLDWLNVSNRQIGCEVELAGRIDEFTTSMHYLENVVADSTMMHLIEPLPHAELWKMFNTKQVSRMHLLEVCLDHNAHHRGALAQYARLLGKEPKLPYFDICDAVERIAAA